MAAKWRGSGSKVVRKWCGGGSGVAAARAGVPTVAQNGAAAGNCPKVAPEWLRVVQKWCKTGPPDVQTWRRRK
eukprot:2007850-Pyramimonas_sp.AAC.1